MPTVVVTPERIIWPPGTQFIVMPGQSPAWGRNGRVPPGGYRVRHNQDGSYSVRNASGRTVATVSAESASRIESTGKSMSEFLAEALAHPGLRAQLAASPGTPVSLGMSPGQGGVGQDLEITIDGTPGSTTSYPLYDAAMNPARDGEGNYRPRRGDYPLAQGLRADIDSLVNDPLGIEGWPVERSALRVWLDERLAEIERATGITLTPEERVRAAELVLGLVPGIGEAFAIYEFIFGRSPMSGDDASRAMALIGIATGGYGDDVLRLIRNGLRNSLADHIADLAGIAKSENRTLVRATPGSRGNWTAELRQPRPNAMYVLDNGHVYRTDAQGRVESVEGRLSLDRLDRSTGAQVRVGREGGAGYDGGHLIGHGVGGAGDGINLVAQMSSVNRGEYRVLEGQWAEAMRAGKTVEVRITPVWSDASSTAPSALQVEYWIDGISGNRLFVN